MTIPLNIIRVSLLGVALVLALAALASPAQARMTVGIADQSTAMLDDPRFQRLGVSHTRLVVPYNVMSDKAAYARYAPVIDTARARGVTLLIAFNHRANSHTYLPSAKAYKREFKKFRKRFPWVKDVSPWNEANHSTQPTFRKPKAAAGFYNIVRANCEGCKIVAADVLDQRGFDKWIRTFRRYAKGKPKYWGLHNYTDVNRGGNTSVRTMRRVIGSGQVWLTETGGIVRLGNKWSYDERRAAKATARMLKNAKKSKVARVYIYRWSGEPLGSRWDSGLVAPDGRARPALNVVERHLGKSLTKLPKAPRIAKFPRARG